MMMMRMMMVMMMMRMMMLMLVMMMMTLSELGAVALISMDQQGERKMLFNVVVAGAV